MRNRHVGGAARVRSCHLTIRSSRDRFAVSCVIHSPAAVRLNSGVRRGYRESFMQARAIAAGIAACLCACAAPPSPAAADVYFRPFEATSFVRLTESIMVTSAGSEFHITDKARLNHIRQLV